MNEKKYLDLANKLTPLIYIHHTDLSPPAPEGTSEDWSSEAAAKAISRALHRLGFAAVSALKEGSASQALPLLEAFTTCAHRDGGFRATPVLNLTKSLRDLMQPKGTLRAQPTSHRIEEAVISAIHDHTIGDILPGSLRACMSEIDRILEQEERSRPKFDPRAGDKAIQEYTKAAFMRSIEVELRDVSCSNWWDPSELSHESILTELHQHLREGSLSGLAKCCLLLHSRGEGLAHKDPAPERAAELRILEADTYPDLEAEVSKALSDIGEQISPEETWSEAKSRFMYQSPQGAAVAIIAAAEGRSKVLISQTEAHEWVRHEERGDCPQIGPSTTRRYSDPERVVRRFGDGSVVISFVDGPHQTWPPRSLSHTYLTAD